MTSATAPILHVENDPNDVVFFKEACHRAQLSTRLESVLDGDRAIAYLSGVDGFEDRDRFPWPALVVLDLKMPGLMGFEVLEWIRSQKETKNLPVLIFTSSLHEEDMRRAYDLGANSYLVKPVLFNDLVEIVKAIHLYWLTLNCQPNL